MRHIIHFVRNDKGMPVGCLAFRDVYYEDTGEFHVEYGFSAHNPSDIWNRKLARQIAIGRMVENPFTLPGNSKWNISKMIEVILQDLPNRNAPKRLLREAARSLKIHTDFYPS